MEEIEEGNPSSVELGHRFARKMLTHWKDIDTPTDDLILCDGSKDGGIDAAYLQRGESETDGDIKDEGDIWYLVQSKYGTAFRGAKTLYEEALKVIDTLNGQRENLSSMVAELIERLTTFRASAIAGQDKIVLLFATDKELNKGQRKVLDDIREIGRGRLGPIFDVEAVSVKSIYDRLLESQPTPLSLPFRGNLVASGNDLLVGSISLTELYTLLKAYRQETEDLDKLFEKNVRRFLGVRGKVNKAMKMTLQNTPDRFGLYNNGITIVVTNFTRREDGTYQLDNPYVVNGCQTTRTIWDVFITKLEAGGQGKNDQLEAWKKRAAEGVVITKVVKVGPQGDTLLHEITRYTNSQNAVRERDFLSLERDFSQWASQLADKYRVFLETQRGGWDSQRIRQRQLPKAEQFTEWANAFSLLKVYGSGWLRHPGTAQGRNAAFVPGGSIFKEIIGVDPSEEAFGVDDLYAAYRLQEAASKFEFGRRARPTRVLTRYLYYFTVVELLRGVMVKAGLGTSHKQVTSALLKLFETNEVANADLLLDDAVHLTDTYLTKGAEDSLFDEPTFLKEANSNISTYLKWDPVGTTEQASPCFRTQIKVMLRSMERKVGKNDSAVDQIVDAIK
jgi:hypothetical protein